MAPGGPPDASARVHVLYVERAEDQRGPSGARSAGVHLGVPGRGPCICDACEGVAEVWRGRLDNLQTTLRMCCAEGSLFRPEVMQFACASPRAGLLYDIPRLATWMSARGSKRPTEALVIGSALRVARGELEPGACGISHSPFEASDDGESEGMWAWIAQFAAGVRARARESGGVAVSLVLDKKGEVLAPSHTAGVLSGALAARSAPMPTDLVLVIGGPSGVPRAWSERLASALGKPLLAVALRGGLQHSYAALLDMLLMHERGELLPLVRDRLACPAERRKRWRQAEHELRRAWLACLTGGEAHAREGDALDAAIRSHEACIEALKRLAPAGAGRGQAASVPAVAERGASVSGSASAPRQKRRRGDGNDGKRQRRRPAAT